MDDDKPVDATIRPVLPSRAAIPAPDVPRTGKNPEWDDAPGGPVDVPQFHNPQLTALEMFSAARKKETPVTRRTKRERKMTGSPKPDARRSAAARDAWKKRRANLGNPSPASKDELAVLMQMMILMEKLPAPKRKAVLTILHGLTS